MIEFIKDYKKNKYKKCEHFHDGMAKVQNWKGLYGFINREGIEVIPCQFDSAEDFSDGLATVLIKDKWGFIDKSGKMVIEPKFFKTRNFSNGFAVAYESDKKCGYIDKTGSFVVPATYSSARDFKEGIGLLQICKGSACYFDGYNIHQISGNLVSDMQEGFVILEEDGEYIIYNSKMNVLYRSHQYDIKTIYGSNCGLFRVVDKNGNFGYLNHSFELEIPCVYVGGGDFSDGFAIVNMTRGTIGIIDKTGKGMQFLRDKHFEYILQFNNRLAVAKVSSKLCYIDSNGNLAFDQYFLFADSFSEGLAFVRTKEDRLSYIDETGKEVIKIPELYCSVLNYNGATTTIEAESVSELIKKKQQALMEIRKDAIKSIDESIKNAKVSIDETEKRFVMTEKKNGDEK